MSNTPSLRFSEFTKDWETQKLSNLGRIITGSTPSTRHAEYYSEDGIPWVTPTDISENIISDTPRKLSSIGAQVGRVVPAETVLVTCIASIGKNAMLTTTGSFNQQINGLVPNKQYYDPYFLLTDSYHWSEKMKREAAAGIMQIVNKNDFSAIETIVPDIIEQQAIGKLFKDIDSILRLHQCELDKYVSLKSACLEKMFPKNGSKVPELRFAGFTGDWRPHLLGNLGDFTSNGVDKKINPGERIVNLLNYMDIYNRRKINSNNCHELMHVSAKESQVQNNNIQKNDVFFTPTSETAEDIGHAMVIEETLENTVYSYHLMRFRPYENVFYPIFPNYCFDTNQVRKQMAIMAQGVQRFVLSKSQFESIVVLLPGIKEQERISECLRSIDDLISFHNKKLDKLKQFKKAMLHNMFV